MSTLIIPAPLWRRLIAAAYDGLLLIGLWMVGALLDVLVRDELLGLDPSRHGLQLAFFLIGLGFFGWSWTHGGQTLGMRVWLLRVRRLDGAPLRWPLAATRYATLLLSWGAALAPMLLLVPRYATDPRVAVLAAICGLATLAAAVHMHLDGRRRAWCDWVAGTEVVQIPKPERRGV